MAATWTDVFPFNNGKTLRGGFVRAFGEFINHGQKKPFQKLSHSVLP